MTDPSLLPDPSTLDARFGTSAAPVREAVAPYRVSPIGVHTDHQDGLTCGFCVTAALRLTFRRSSGCALRLASTREEDVIETDLGASHAATDGWRALVLGLVEHLARRVTLRHGIEGVVHGELPSGGVGSSAALQVAVLLALLDANGETLPGDDAARLVVEAERASTGVRVGLLDPMVILHGKENAFVFLDCRKGVPRLHRLARSAPAFEVLLVDAGVPRTLRDTPYNERVEECRVAARACGVAGDEPVLRDVEPERFRRLRATIDPVAARRAEHVFSENKRVKLAQRALASGDLVGLGRLMNASAASLTRAFDCGVPETTRLLEILAKIDGVLGANHAGAGFGGLVQALARPGTVSRVQEALAGSYADAFPAAASAAAVMSTELGGGAHVR